MTYRIIDYVPQELDAYLNEESQGSASLKAMLFLVATSNFFDKEDSEFLVVNDKAIIAATRNTRTEGFVVFGQLVRFLGLAESDWKDYVFATRNKTARMVRYTHPSIVSLRKRCSELLLAGKKNPDTVWVNRINGRVQRKTDKKIVAEIDKKWVNNVQRQLLKEMRAGCLPPLNLPAIETFCQSLTGKTAEKAWRAFGYFLTTPIDQISREWAASCRKGTARIFHPVLSNLSEDFRAIMWVYPAADSDLVSAYESFYLLLERSLDLSDLDKSLSAASSKEEPLYKLTGVLQALAVTAPNVKKLLKTAKSPILLGQGRVSLATEYVKMGFSDSVIQSVLESEWLGNLLARFQRSSKAAQEAGGVVDMYGNWLKLSDFKNVSSMFAYYFSLVEQAVLAALPSIAVAHGGWCPINNHDGVQIVAETEEKLEKINEEAIKSVTKAGERLGLKIEYIVKRRSAVPGSSVSGQWVHDAGSMAAVRAGDEGVRTALHLSVLLLRS